MINNCDEDIVSINSLDYSAAIRKMRRFFEKKGWIEVHTQSRLGILAVCDKGAPLTIPPNNRLETVTQDLRRQRGLHDLLFGKARELNIQVVVHTSQEMKATRTGAAAHALNVDAVRAILDFAERHPTIQRLVMRSCVEVYQVQRDLPALISEEHPLNMNDGAPQWVRDRVEADVTACTRMGLASFDILVLRMAEILSPVIIKAKAFCAPIIRGKKNVPPESGIKPILENA